MPQHRALEWLALYGQRYPGVWDQYADIQRMHTEHVARESYELAKSRGKTPDMMAWPSWCWCPLVGAHFVISMHGRGGRKDMDDFGAPVAGTGELGAVANWRPTQGIYRIDPTLFEELANTSVRGKLPVEVLKRLPAWCVYVECTSPLYHDNYLVEGFFAHMDWVPDDANARSKEQTLIRFALSVKEYSSLVPMMLDIGEVSTIEEAFPYTLDTVMAHLDRVTDPAAQGKIAEDREFWRSTLTMKPGKPTLLQQLVSITLYLCAEETDIPRPALPKDRWVKTKKGKLISPMPTRPTIIDCGTRIGAELRWSREQQEKGELQGDGTRTVAPHIRSAHYHTFLTGPRDQERIPRVKWLPPIRVKLDDVPEHATVHPVK